MANGGPVQLEKQVCLLSLYFHLTTSRMETIRGYWWLLLADASPSVMELFVLVQVQSFSFKFKGLDQSRTLNLRLTTTTHHHPPPPTTTTTTNFSPRRGSATVLKFCTELILTKRIRFGVKKNLGYPPSPLGGWIFRFFLCARGAFMRTCAWGLHAHRSFILHPSSFILYPSSFTLHHLVLKRK